MLFVSIASSIFSRYFFGHSCNGTPDATYFSWSSAFDPKNQPAMTLGAKSLMIFTLNPCSLSPESSLKH